LRRIRGGRPGRNRFAVAPLSKGWEAVSGKIDGGVGAALKK
jgi:hypothetical protein